MSIAYILSRKRGKNICAFTLKSNEDELDVAKSRDVAKRFKLALTEVKVAPNGKYLSLSSHNYDPSRKLISEKNLGEFIQDEIVQSSLYTSASPKKDNAFCAFAMQLIGRALQDSGFSAVFCGEGPNEMLNDYGFVPSEYGYPSNELGDIGFREALTFGQKKTDRQLGRGGLAKHATARMGKIFAAYGIRLEAPYFNQDISRIMTKIPHKESYDKIKQCLMHEVFKKDGFNDLIVGVSKEKFQDGSGVSKLFKDYTQQRLLEIFKDIYGVMKTGYLGQ